MRRFTAVVLAVLSVVLATGMIVKSNQRWEGNAEDLMKTLTPDALISRCGQPAADIASGSTITNRRMFYPISKDRSIGLVFSFHRTLGTLRWNYSSFRLGTSKGREPMEMEDIKGSNSWAIIELPCLGASRREPSQR
jgi:hypothetical protein